VETTGIWPSASSFSSGVEVAHEILADRQQDHPYDLHRLRRGDPKPLMEAGFDAHPVEHRRDLRPAAVHHDHPRGLGQLAHVGREDLGLLHGVPAVLDDDRVAHELYAEFSCT
jgi:hypothetical protein